ncbi:ferric iron reductase [Effusibacillus pohliae]|uniref:ferric iron reductase n=1 Tax=Effusibacillus pohliae TaxID=232270 RepID=UPI00036C6B6F|nr:ferric iron reductase [Effusibacillus pohliae]
MQQTVTLSKIQVELLKRGLQIPLEVEPVDAQSQRTANRPRSVSPEPADGSDTGSSGTFRPIRTASSQAAIAQHELDASETVSVQQLLAGNTLRLVVERVADRMNSSNRLAAASLFQKRYASVLLASVLHPLLSANIGILADAEQTAIRLREHLPVAIRFLESVEWFDLSVCHRRPPATVRVPRRLPWTSRGPKSDETEAQIVIHASPPRTSCGQKCCKRCSMAIWAG